MAGRLALKNRSDSEEESGISRGYISLFRSLFMNTRIYLFVLAYLSSSVNIRCSLLRHKSRGI